MKPIFSFRHLVIVRQSGFLKYGLPTIGMERIDSLLKADTSAHSGVRAYQASKHSFQGSGKWLDRLIFWFLVRASEEL